jgi:hypothetical protein
MHHRVYLSVCAEKWSKASIYSRRPKRHNRPNRYTRELERENEASEREGDVRNFAKATRSPHGDSHISKLGGHRFGYIA